MYAATALAGDLISTAIKAALAGNDALHEALEALPAPIYVTNADGLVTYFNKACIGFTGRTPSAGKDRWCVTWKLYTNDGDFLPHEECPMAVAIKDRRTIRGLTAVAARPDGTRVNFLPFPTPIVGPNGDFLGAVNLLIDITELRQIDDLRRQAMRARRLTLSCADELTVTTLGAMADEYEAKALEMEARVTSPYVRLA